MKSKLLLSTSVLFLLAFAITRNSAQGQVAPGPEHAVLKRMEGTWTARVKMGDQVSDATASYKMECGGLWLISDFQGQMGGEKFQGRGMDGYDPGKQSMCQCGWTPGAPGHCSSKAPMTRRRRRLP